MQANRQTGLSYHSTVLEVKKYMYLFKKHYHVENYSAILMQILIIFEWNYHFMWMFEPSHESQT